jgi:D-proline reductase (dithiol) PrdB
MIQLSRYCVPFTPFRGTLEEAQVMLVSTAGVHHKDDPPFETEGDTSFRVIAADARAADLRVADTHYDHGCIDHDLNCVFPVDRLYELAEERRLRAVAEKHFSLGFTQALRQLRDETIPKLVREVEIVRPDAVLLTGG